MRFRLLNKCLFLPYQEAIRLRAGDQAWQLALTLQHKTSQPNQRCCFSASVCQPVWQTGIHYGQFLPSVPWCFLNRAGFWGVPVMQRKGNPHLRLVCQPRPGPPCGRQCMNHRRFSLSQRAHTVVLEYPQNYSCRIFSGTGVTYYLSQEPVGLWSSSKSSITSNPLRTTTCTLHGSPGSRLQSKQ